jgi:general stress protein 26
MIPILYFTYSRAAPQVAGVRSRLDAGQRTTANAVVSFEKAQLTTGQERAMDQTLRKRILDLMKRHNIMTIATVRKDGYPQATTVTYVNDGLTLYFGCEKRAQKVKNIKRCGKVSLTIDRDYRDWNRIRGLSMAADAEVLTDGDEVRQAAALLAKKFPQWGTVPPDDVRFVKVVPKVISILDYAQGFGHTDLMRA